MRFDKLVLLAAVGLLAVPQLVNAECGEVTTITFFDTINPGLLTPETDDRNGSLLPGPSFGPNDILDSDEFAVLAAILVDTGNPLNVAACNAYQANTTQMLAEFGGNPGNGPFTLFGKVSAAYMTLGDADTVAAISAYLAQVPILISITTANFDTSLASKLAFDGDADDDGLTNKQEYDAIPGTGGPGSAKRAQYLIDALTPDVPCTGELAAGCPPLQLQGAGLIASLESLSVLPPGSDWDTFDLDQQGIIDAYEVALLQHVICGNGLGRFDAVCIFNDNLATVANESVYPLIGPNADDVVAALLSLGSETQAAFTGLGFTGSYTAIGTGAKSGNEPLSPSGDLDGDGVTNLQEYLNVLAAGGDIEDYVLAASNALTDGSDLDALPVAGIAGLAALFAMTGALSAVAMRRKRD